MPKLKKKIQSNDIKFNYSRKLSIIEKYIH